jgi:hypothetical protein
MQVGLTGRWTGERDAVGYARREGAIIAIRRSLCIVSVLVNGGIPQCKLLRQFVSGSLFLYLRHHGSSARLPS